MKTVKDLASEVAKKEGKKTQARIGEVREIIGHLSDLSLEGLRTGEYSVGFLLHENGKRRAKRKKN